MDCARPKVQDIFDTLEDIGDDFETTAKKLMEYFQYTSFGSCPMKKKHFMIMPLVDYASRRLCHLDVSENLAPEFPNKGGAKSPTPLPPCPQESAPLCIFFALLAMNGPLPAELKFRENTGIVHTKQLLCSYVWFPGLDTVVEREVGKYLSCQATTVCNTIEPLVMTEFPSGPWRKVCGFCWTISE